MLGEHTDFFRFLKAMAEGHIYYDPAIKLEQASTIQSENQTPQPVSRPSSGNCPPFMQTPNVSSFEIFMLRPL